MRPAKRPPGPRPRAARRARPEPPAVRRSLAPLVWAVAAAAVAAVVYANSLGNQLVYDDLGVIVANRAVRDPGDWRTIVFSHSWFAAPSREHRPLTTWTFALDYAAHGLAPLGYHLGNVVAHAAVTALVVPVALAVGTPLPAAGLGALLFAVHPIHTEAVASVVGRAELLAAALGLVTLLLARRLDGTPRPAAVVAATAATYALAIASKEHVAALVAVVPLADLLLADAGSLARFRERLAGRRLALYAALAAVTVAYLVVRRVALGDLIGAGGVVAPSRWQNPAAGVAWWRRVLTALYLQGRAMGLLVLPVGLTADYSYRTIPVVESIAEPRAIAGLALVAALAALGVWCWRTGRWRACFWLAFAWLVSLPVSNLPFPIGTIFAERALYLPSVAFCVVAGELLALRRGPWLVALIVAAGAIGTWSRNRAWHDELSLAEATAEASPESTQAHRLLGWAYASRGREDDAVAEYRRAVEIDPENDTALADYATIVRRRRGADESVAALRAVADGAAASAPAWTAVGFAELARNRPAEALEAAERALAMRPSNARASALRGFALRGLGRADDARAAFERALAADATLAEAYLGLGGLALDAGDASGAAAIFERMVRATESPDAYRRLVESYRRAGREADAARALAAARRRFPTDPSFR